MDDLSVSSAVIFDNVFSTFPPPLSSCSEMNVTGWTSSISDSPNCLNYRVTLRTFLLSFVLSAVIVGTVIGNSFVVISVIAFDKMRTLSNGLIASLASADLLVAVAVLPISLQYETNARWTLGTRVCDLWITSDVFCCTASILNIVVIAIDRYWLITRNVRYTHSSKLPRRRVCAVLLTAAWLMAALIASSPLLGWRTGTERTDPSVCLISQDLGYTVVSTFGAFWFPLGVILVVYARIFAFARRRTANRRSAFDPNTEILAAAGTNQKRSSICNGGHRIGVTTSGCGTNGRSSIARIVVDRQSEFAATAAASSTAAEVYEARDGTIGIGQSCIDKVIEDDDIAKQTTSLTTKKTNLSSMGTGWNTLTLPTCGYSNNDQSFVSYSITPQESGAARTATSADDDVENMQPDTMGDDDGRIDLSVYVVATATATSVGIGDAVATCGIAAAIAAADRRRKRRRAILVRRSARTLGLIIGGFVACWLPFFVVATIMPLCTALTHQPTSTCRVSPTVSSVVLWLGYSNSLLNPAIYAIWDQSFRRSFQRLAALCFCCCCGGGSGASRGSPCSCGSCGRVSGTKP